MRSAIPSNPALLYQPTSGLKTSPVLTELFRRR
jgi:hypothetical protein